MDGLAQTDRQAITASEAVLLHARRFAGLSRSARLGSLASEAAPYAIGVFFAVAIALSMPQQDGGSRLIWWPLGGAVAGLLLALYAWQQVFRRERTLFGPVDEGRLERMLFAAALLANERDGLIRLTPLAAELLAEPTGSDAPRPPGSVEQMVKRGRPLAISELVSDIRAAPQGSLARIAQAAAARGLLRPGASRRGACWEASAPALAMDDGDAAARLLDGCRALRPALWAALQSGIEDGLARQAAAPDARFQAGAMPGSLSRAETMERDRLEDQRRLPVAGGRTTLAVLWRSTLWLLPIAGLYALLPTPLGPAWWPLACGLLAALAVGVAGRQMPRNEPPPIRGSAGEEAALARARTPSGQARPWQDLLADAIGGGSIVTWLALACSLGGATGAILFAIVLAMIVTALVARTHLARRPSAREIELAVARRSRELTAAAPPELEGEFAPPAGEGGACERPLHLMEARDLPPPSPAAVVLCDRRRGAAMRIMRRQWAAAMLFMAGQAALTAAFWRWSGNDPLGLLFVAAPWAVCLAVTNLQALKALHRLRPVAWQVAPSLAGRLLRGLGRLPSGGSRGAGPDAIRGLRNWLHLEPRFWQDEAFDIGSPLGIAPAVALAFWLVFLLVATVIVPWASAGRVEPAALGFATLGYAMAAAFLWARRVPPPAWGQGKRLLLLRVFGSPSFDDLSALVKPFLLAGPINHLEGYDSVVRSQEAVESLAAGRLDDSLVKSADDLARRLAADDGLPGPGLRYHRAAFQCIDATWKQAIQAMMARSDVVLMDLSGLSPTNQGCAYELGLLLDRVSLSRVLLLVSETTDLDCLRSILATAERQLAPDSPNRASRDQPWRLLRINGLVARGETEDALQWLRRLDGRVQPMDLVSHLLGMAIAPGNARAADAPCVASKQCPC